jgi:hypothetical protein
MDVQICTTAPPNSPYIFNHVFLRVKPPKSREWMWFDPVLYPKKPLGSITDHDRLAVWSLNGNLLLKEGKYPPRFDEIMALYGVDQALQRVKTPTGTKQGVDMYNNLRTPYWGYASGVTPSDRNPNYHDFYDYSDQAGFFGADEIVDEQNPQQMAMATTDEQLPDFSRYGIVGFGCYSGLMGSINGDRVPHIMAEYDSSDTIGDTGLVRTKIFELDPAEYIHVQQTGSPRYGALALSDDGEIYEWQQSPTGLGGFFKRLVRRIRKGVRKIGGKIRKGLRKVGKRIKKFIRKTRFGRFLWKVGSKIFKTAMKFVKPLVKLVGKVASKIAPIAALIPGIGPAVSAGLALTGKVIKIARSLGVKFDAKKRPILKNKQQAKAFATALAKEGKKMGKGKAQRIIAKYRRMKSGKMSGFGDVGVMADDQSYSYRMPAVSGIGWV